MTRPVPNLHPRALLLALALGLAACGDAPTAATPDPAPSQAAAETAAPADGVMQLAWEDLMPDGEDAVLEALYTEFYQEFEARMMQNQTPLSSAVEPTGDEAFDLAMVAEGSDLDSMTQIGTFNVVDDLDGQTVRLPGYIVPLDFSAESEHSEFLLVPYFGACLHSPPPPPNQIVYVTADPAAKIPDIYEPVWLVGEMKTGRFDTHMANSAYELRLGKLEPYEY